MVNINELKNRLVEICGVVYKENLVKEGEGNISLRVPQNNEMIITPAGNDYLNLETAKMVQMRLDGTLLDKGSKPSSEFRMHRAIYKERPNVNCIIHTHSPYASMLAVSHQSIPYIIDEMGIFLGGSVPCTAYYPAGSESLAKEILRVMKKQNTTIIANHGVVVIGKTSEYCIKVANIIEKMAQIYIGALKIGKVQIIPKEHQTSFIEIFEKKYSTFKE